MTPPALHPQLSIRPKQDDKRAPKPLAWLTSHHSSPPCLFPSGEFGQDEQDVQDEKTPLTWSARLASDSVNHPRTNTIVILKARPPFPSCLSCLSLSGEFGQDEQDVQDEDTLRILSPQLVSHSVNHPRTGSVVTRRAHPSSPSCPSCSSCLSPSGRYGQDVQDRQDEETDLTRSAWIASYRPDQPRTGSIVTRRAHLSSPSCTSCSSCLSPSGEFGQDGQDEKTQSIPSGRLASHCFDHPRTGSIVTCRARPSSPSCTSCSSCLSLSGESGQDEKTQSIPSGRLASQSVLHPRTGSIARSRAHRSSLRRVV